MPRRGQSKRKLDQHKEEEEEDEQIQYDDDEEEEEEEEKQPSKKSKPNTPVKAAVSEVTCPICCETASTRSDVEFRVLAGCCNRIYCMTCLLSMMKGEATKRELKCPFCGKNHRLHDSSGLLSDEELIEEKSSLYSSAFYERNGISMSPASTSATAVRVAAPERCSQQGCPKRAAYYCDDGCGDLCESHHNQLHPPVAAAASSSNSSPSGHKTMLIDEKAVFLQERERRRMEVEASVNARKPRIEAAKKEIEEMNKTIETESKSLVGECQQAVQARLDQLKKQDTDADGLIALGERIKTTNAKERQAITLRQQWFLQHGNQFNELKQQLDAKSKRLESLLVVPLDAAKHVTDAEFDQHRDTSGLKKKVADLSENRKIMMARVQLSVAPDLTSKFIKYLNQCSLLPVNGSKSRRELQRFLPAGISLNDARLQYKMSRDGSQAVDFYRLCCNRDQGRLLMLIKAAESGYVFGAFINISLPQPPADGSYLTVPDASGQSFLFSLTNRYNTPFKLRLKADHKHLAFQLCNFGNLAVGALVKVGGNIVKYPSLILFNGGKSADIKDANLTNHHLIAHNDTRAYELDESSFHGGNPKPAGFLCDTQVLAGADPFAAAEIEVYLI